MIDGISRVESRLREIAGRIDQITKIGREQGIEALRGKPENTENPSAQGEQSFSEILKEVMKDNKGLAGNDEGKQLINMLAGSKGDNKQLLELMFKQLRAQTVTGDVDTSVDDASKSTGLDSDLIRAVISQESEFDPKAVSKTGAMGLMQLMPDTAKDLGVTNPFDVKQNVNGGSRYLKEMVEKYGGDLNRALAAYNAGPAAVDKYNGIPPYAETQDYVKQVLSRYNELKNYKADNSK